MTDRPIKQPGPDHPIILVRSEGAGQVSSLIPGSTDKNPDFTWESKGRITDRGYEIEIRIPLKSLRYPAGGPQTWGFNVTRVVQRTGYAEWR